MMIGFHESDTLHYSGAAFLSKNSKTKNLTHLVKPLWRIVPYPRLPERTDRQTDFAGGLPPIPPMLRHPQIKQPAAD